MKSVPAILATSLAASYPVGAEEVVAVTPDQLSGPHDHLVLLLRHDVTYRFDQRERPIDLARVRFVDDGLTIDAAQLVGADVRDLPSFDLTAHASRRPTAPWSFDLDHDTRDLAGRSLELAYYEVSVPLGASTVTVPVYFCKTWG
jgi:hypothetical protein